MALPVVQQIRIWTVAAVALLAVLWFLGDIVLPFVLGGAIAYFLDPVADLLERMGLGRALATAAITLAAMLAFAVMGLAVAPAAVSQAAALAEAAPRLADGLQTFLSESFPSLMDRDSVPRQSLDALGELVRSGGGALVDGLVLGALGLLNVLLLALIVPVVAFYLLLDWDRMVASLDRLLPRDHAPTVRELALEIDRTLAAFIRGQGTVMLILAALYGAALTLVGLDFGLVVGVAAGLLSFIPYVGAAVGGGLAVGLALFQFWGEWGWIGAVAAIFLAGQLLEGNVLTPRLVGGSVGLHPVWLIFALSVFGSSFGFVGLLVAVPVAAALGVLARFALERYVRGRLYRGERPSGENPEEGPGTDRDPWPGS